CRIFVSRFVLWPPHRSSPVSPSSRSWLTIIGRLQSGQTVESAGAGLKAVEPQIRQATIPPNFPKQFADRYLAGREGFIAVPAATGNSTLRRRYERPLLAILVVVALVLRHGRDFQSFHVKDPDGFDLQISNGNRKNRRQGSAN